MLPLKDNQPTRKTPVITVLIILINLFVFGFELSLSPEEFRAFISTWGFTPASLSGGNVFLAVVTLFTSMFIHGGLFHVGGNMLYMWVFGDNIEDKLGSFKFLIFYLLTGLSGAAAQ
ncbi:MAG: rhomboid family intramembrane serine protease, partial [bacterium]